MTHIFHVIHIKAPQEKTYKALTTEEGLRAWWTKDMSGTSEEGKMLEFGFKGQAVHDKMKVARLTPPTHVEWLCTDGTSEWIGTRIRFELAKEDGGTVLRFSHREWKAETDFYGLCNATWGWLLVESLTKYLEGGKGNPLA